MADPKPKPFSDKKIKEIEKGRSRWYHPNILKSNEHIREGRFLATIAAKNKRIEELEKVLGILAGLRRWDHKTRKVMAGYVRKISRKVLRKIDPVPGIYKRLCERIAELEVYDGNDDHPENRCEICRGRNLHNWFADSDIWNRATQNKWGVLCPNCFVELARKIGIDPASWRISIPSDDSEIGKCHVRITRQATTIERLRGERKERDELLNNVVKMDIDIQIKKMIADFYEQQCQAFKRSE